MIGMRPAMHHRQKVIGAPNRIDQRCRGGLGDHGQMYRQIKPAGHGLQTTKRFALFGGVIIAPPQRQVQVLLLPQVQFAVEGRPIGSHWRSFICFSAISTLWVAPSNLKL